MQAASAELDYRDFLSPELSAPPFVAMVSASGLELSHQAEELVLGSEKHH